MGDPIEPPRHGEVAARSADGGVGSEATGFAAPSTPPDDVRGGPPPRSGEVPANTRSAAWVTALAIFVADQLTKWIVIGPLDLKERYQIELLPIFNLTWTENRGISLGLGQAETDLQRWLLVAGTAAVAALVGFWITREKARGDQLALAMVLGGALGNIVDRIRFGYVVDFLDLHFGDFRPFLVFNVADAAISIGVVVLLLRALLVKPDAKEERIEHV